MPKYTVWAKVARWGLGYEMNPRLAPWMVAFWESEDGKRYYTEPEDLSEEADE